MKAHREECLRIHLEMMTEECKRHVNRMCYPEAAAAGRAGIESARKLKDPISEAKCHGLVGVALQHSNGQDTRQERLEHARAVLKALDHDASDTAAGAKAAALINLG